MATAILAVLAVLAVTLIPRTAFAAGTTDGEVSTAARPGGGGGGGGTPTPPDNGNGGGGGGTPTPPDNGNGGGGGTPTPPDNGNGGGGTPTPPDNGNGGGGNPTPPPVTPITSASVENLPFSSDDKACDPGRDGWHIVLTGVVTSDGSTPGASDVGDISLSFTNGASAVATYLDTESTTMHFLYEISPFLWPDTVTSADMTLPPSTKIVGYRSFRVSHGPCITAAPDLSLVKAVESITDTDTSETTTIGDVINYKFSATNNGNVNLTNVVITDELPGLSALSCDQTSPATLAPEASLNCTATYTVTADDADTGEVVNVADVAALDPDGGELTDSDSTTTPVVSPQLYAIRGVAWFDRNRNGLQDPGEPPLRNVRLTLGASGAPTSAGWTRGYTVRNGATFADVATTVTDANGRYLFVNIAPGTYVVRAASGIGGLRPTFDTDGGSDWSATATVVDDIVDVEFAAVGEGSLGGVISDLNTGAPIPGALIDCTWEGEDAEMGTEDDIAFSVTAGPDGSYLIEGFPYGQVSCTATDPATGDSQTFDAEVDSPEPVRVDAVFGTPPADPPATPPADLPVEPVAEPVAVLGGLPATGADVTNLLTTAAVLLVLGGGLAALTRRRRTTTTTTPPDA